MRRILAVVAVCVFAALPSSAATFIVNNLGDGADATPGNGACATADAVPVCTLRAAIMEANATAGIDSVNVMVAGTITPATALPPVTDRTFINATAAPGYVSSPVVIVDGGGAIATGFDFAGGSAGSQLTGFEIRGFPTTAVSFTSSGNAIYQSYVGPITGGTANGTGILVNATATGTAIGGTTTVNVISGNGTGILIDGASGTWIRGNFIGTNAAGTAALPNGIGIAASGTFTSVGLSSAGVNVISGNSIHGINIGGSDVTVAGNYIGTDVTGLIAIPNNVAGIYDNGTNSTIGTADYRNIISGTVGAGLVLSGDSAVLANNWIGIGSDGATAIPNQWGIVEMGTANAIGTADARNVISGNLTEGILVNPTSVDPTIRNNYIGLDATGTIAVPNGQNGIAGDNASFVTIGGPDPSDANVVSGNAQSGIRGGFTQSGIVSNVIGLNAAGTAAVPNALNGITLISGDHVTIARNTVSGNAEDGIHLTAVTDIVVAENRVGTDITGAAAVPNVDSGVESRQASNVALSANLISGNTGAGVDINGASTAINLVSNIIGRTIGNAGPLANGLEGVRVLDTSSGVTIGAPGSGNVIASNVAWNGGVLITGSATALIRANSIFDNGALGIDLMGPGVTPNDPGDTDTGANALQNFPLLAGAVSDATQSFISGTLDSTPSTSFTLDFFSNAVADPSGHGEGQTYLGSTAVTTDASGNAAFMFAGSPLPFGTVISSTATAATGTSEFSADVTVAAMPTIQFSSATYDVSEGDGTATITVTRSGDLSPTSTVTFATTDGTAATGADYVSVTGVLTFASGVASQTFTVPITDDMIDEAGETVTLTLSAPSAATLGSPSTATLTITDDDGIPTVTIDDVSTTEGDAGTTSMNFTVTLSNPSATSVTVDFSTADVTATGGFDYGASVGTLTFAPGDTAETITIPVNGDTAFEMDETFVVDLTNPVNATLADAQGTGTIVNDDVAVADLTIAKTGPPTANAGNDIAYGIVVTNAGPDTATNVVVSDVLPAGTTFVSATTTVGSCSGTTTVTCSVGTLAAGAVVEMTITVRSSTAGTITNTAMVTGTETDPTPANNASSATTTVAEAVVADVPTLSEWLLLCLAGLLAAAAMLRMRA